MSEPGVHAPNPLLTAPILPLLLKFALPNMVAMLATALAAIAETAYVGRFGSPALAGMALVFPFVMFQMMLSAGAMGGGVSSAVSRAFGAGAGATLIEEAAKTNRAVFERAMQMFPGFGYGRSEPAAPPAAETKAAADGDALEEMRRQMDEMRAQIDRLAGSKPK